MTIERKLRTSGKFLFRWRSFIPLVLLVPGIIILINGLNIEEAYGEDAEDVWLIACLCVSLLGLGIRCFTIGYIATGTSGRNTTHQRADHLNTTGMYSICRNPLYLGNFFGLFGVVLAFQNAWFAMLIVLAYWLYIERVIAAEEEFLAEKHGETFLEYAGRTPIMLPRLSLWKSPELPFSLKTVLKREYSGVLALFAAFYILELVSDVVIESESLTHWMHRDWIWSALMLVGITTFLVLRTAKKYTGLLKVENR